MPDVRSMCAIGRNGQLGLGGRMPWEGNRDAAFVADVQRFWSVTEGHVIAAGPRTIASIPAIAYESRTIFTIRSHMAPEDVIAQFPGRVIYIGGGPAVWTAYAHLISQWDITRLPYGGEADRWFDPAWLLQGDQG